ncbi:MAG: hypothetical protein ACPGYV_00855 [Phycisphaeraceae bacterium]
MQAAIADTIQSEPYVAEFDRFYPNAQHFISYYTGDYGEPTWNSEVTIDQTFILTMQYQLSVDSSGRKTKRASDPHFYINIIDSTQQLPDGRTRTSFSGGTDFGPEGWKQVVAAQGDLTAVIPEEELD